MRISDWSSDLCSSDLAGRGLPACGPVPYAEIGDGGPGLRRCLEQLQRDGFVVVEGAPTDEASARRLFGNFGYIRETLFGGLWSLSAALKEPDDPTYPTAYLDPPTDDPHNNHAPCQQGFLGRRSAARRGGQ